MPLEPNGPGELGFVEALMKRGFINIPRMLFDYTSDLGLDYPEIGMIFAVLACIGGPGENAFGSYTVTRRNLPRDFDQVRDLVVELEKLMITRCDKVTDNEITFSFGPLFARLRAVWSEYREAYEKEMASRGPHPAVGLAEKLLSRPLSTQEVRTILDWVEELGFTVEMVEAVLREGIRTGVTRIKYLDSIATQWAQAGLQTPEQVAAYLEEHQKTEARYRKATQALGIKRPLTAAEQAMMERWYGEWGFDDDVVLQACEQAAGAKNPLQYTNKVLESWLQEGIRTTADLDRLLAQKRRTAAAGLEPGRAARGGRKGSGQSNVILKREKKDDSYYDVVFKRFGE